MGRAAMAMREEDEVLDRVGELWKQYLVLTRELLKFIDKQDIDTFMSIVPQRDVLIERMKALPANDFRRTEECRAMIEEIRLMDQQIMYKARSWLNKSRRQNQAVQSYKLSPALDSAGIIFNRKY